MTSSMPNLAPSINLAIAIKLYTEIKKYSTISGLIEKD